jgi:uncharacterized protein YPO0396
MSHTTQNRIVTIPGYIPPPLCAPAPRRIIAIRPLTQAERKRRKQAAEEAAEAARNALQFRNEQLKGWKKAPLKDQKAANYYLHVYFERLNELLGK